MKTRQFSWLHQIFCASPGGFSNIRTELARHQNALDVLRSGLSYHVTKLLQSPDISLAEQALLSQILPELRLPYTTSLPQAVSVRDNQTSEDQWDLVEPLNRSGDTGGAILLLHTLLAEVCYEANDHGVRLEMLHHVGTDFIQRVTVILDRLNITLMPEERRILEEPAVVILPFNLISHTLLMCPRIETREFTRMSFAWHWIRHDFMIRVQTDPVVDLCILRWHAFYLLDGWVYNLEDAFGQSYAHVVLLVAGGNDILTKNIIKRVLLDGKDPSLLGSKSLRQDGHTLLAYAAATGLEQTFAYLLDRWVVDPQPGVEDPFSKPLSLIATLGNINMIRRLLAVPDLRMTRVRLRQAETEAKWYDQHHMVEWLQKEAREMGDSR